MIRFLIINGTILLLSVAIGVCLAMYGGTERNWAITFSILSAILMLAISFGFEIRTLPYDFRVFREDIAAAVDIARRHRVLRLVLDEILANLKGQMVLLRNSSYIDEKGTIPQLSVRTIEGVQKGAFATFIVDERERAYATLEGKRYLSAWFGKARELSGRGEVCRVFVVEDIGEVTDETVRLMVEHRDNGVRVLVINRKFATEIAERCELDFGIFDSDCLMTVTPREGSSSILTVFVRAATGVNDATLDRYLRFKERLSANALDFEMFKRTFVTPINAHFWNHRYMSGLGSRLGPPHGLSRKDAETMVALALQGIPPGSAVRLAILGLTPQLIECCLAVERIAEIVLLDQTPVTMPAENQRVRRVTVNWLEFATEPPFDAIIGDEALNNLALQQYGTFFRNIRGLLRYDGKLVMRTLARYGNGGRSPKTNVDELLEFIRAEALQLRDIDRSVRLIWFLHSPSIAFDEKRSAIDTGRYNALLEAWVERHEVSEEAVAPFWFPTKDNTRILLTSPNSDQLFDASRGTFNQMPFVDVDTAYCGHDCLLRDFYRITPFVAKNGTATLQRPH